MEVAFRTDASTHIGTGHVIRCVTLAKALHVRGVKSKFLCREGEGNLIGHIQREGFEVLALPAIQQTGSNQIADEPEEIDSEGLGASWQTDAQQTIDALSGQLVDLFIVDHYALDRRWEEMVRAHASRIMVIDDLANRNHNCDLLLDQNMVANFESRYDPYLSNDPVRLLGPEYALLNAEYPELHLKASPRIGPIQKVLIFFGGVDKHNLTKMALGAFLKLKRTDISVDVVLGPSNPRAAELKAQIEKYDNITAYDSLPTLANLMLKADISIGAFGAASWERCCLGLPTIGVTLADNQIKIAEELSSKGLARWVGHYDAITEDGLAMELKNAIKGQGLEACSRACMEVVSGKGANKVASILALHSDTSLQARPAQLTDEDLLLIWANDPLVRKNAFNSEVISLDSHREWFRARLGDSRHCKMYVLETGDGFPVGQVRFEYDGMGWVIDYSLGKFARGRGLGKKLLETAVREFSRKQKGTLLMGRVKVDNKASCSVFEALGFAKKVRPDHFFYSRRFG